MRRPFFLWDSRPGANIDHIAEHGLTTALWEAVFHAINQDDTDKDDPSIHVAEGRVKGVLYRIVYQIDDETIIPVTIFPITGFPITRRGLPRRKS